MSQNSHANPAQLMELLESKQLKQASRVFRAINHDLRLSMVRLLAESGKLTVTQIYFKLRIEQSVASQHLAILRDSQLLNFNREGKNIYYSLNEERIQALIASVEMLALPNEEDDDSKASSEEKPNRSESEKDA
jgi:ArsR family transcriptional regulator, virulence genes transcriptional regulator